VKKTAVGFEPRRNAHETTNGLSKLTIAKIGNDYVRRTFYTSIRTSSLICRIFLLQTARAIKPARSSQTAFFDAIS
jgi:hypothetical protein